MSVFGLYCLVFNVRFPSILKIEVVGLSGLEPPTSRLSGVRSNRLSYKPIYKRQRANALSLMWWR